MHVSVFASNGVCVVVVVVVVVAVVVEIVHGSLHEFPFVRWQFPHIMSFYMMVNTFLFGNVTLD